MPKGDSCHPILNKTSQPNPGIYTIKTQNKNLNTCSNISIGDPYQDPHRRSKVNSRFTGKQLLSNPPKNTSGNVGFFEKYSYSSNAYIDRTQFLKGQPFDRRKLGFGSHDAARRDEFTTTVRTEQYRQQLATEAKSYDAKKTGSQPDAEPAPEEKGFPANLKETKYLYDIGRSQFTDFDPKSSRDTFYNALTCKSRTRPPRRTGGYWLSSAETGAGVAEMEMEKPTHGHIKTTKNFYDRSHLGQAPLS